MGGKQSRHRHEAPSEVVVTQVDPLDQRVVVALQEARKRSNQRSSLPFDKLLLKFPDLRRGLHSVRSAFDAGGSCSRSAAGAGNAGPRIEERIAVQTPAAGAVSSPAVEEQITIEDAKAAAVRIGLKVSDQDLDRAFEAAHLNGGDTLDFNDFLTALTIIILQLGPDDAIAQGADPQVVESVMMMVDSFNHFDQDASGYLRRNEVLNTLQEVDKPAHAPRTGGEPAASPIQQRWQQMDWDRDGRATLRDYVVALRLWVEEELGPAGGTDPGSGPPPAATAGAPRSRLVGSVPAAG